MDASLFERTCLYKSLITDALKTNFSELYLLCITSKKNIKIIYIFIKTIGISFIINNFQACQTLPFCFGPIKPRFWHSNFWKKYFKLMISWKWYKIIFFGLLHKAKAMFLFCVYTIITKVYTILDIYKRCQSKQVQNRLGHIWASITTKIITFLKSGIKTYKTLYPLQEKYIDLVDIEKKVWFQVWISRCVSHQFLVARARLHSSMCLSVHPEMDTEILALLQTRLWGPLKI